MTVAMLMHNTLLNFQRHVRSRRTDGALGSASAGDGE
jgi:hypothetical protein